MNHLQPAPQPNTDAPAVPGWPHGEIPVTRATRRQSATHDDDGTACCFLVRNEGGAP